MSVENNPVSYIRKTVFGCETQDAFAAVLGTRQATISRWEAMGRIPGHKQALVREKAKQRGPWDDHWFFSVPSDHCAGAS